LKKFLPFVITSIPMAFIGASFRLKEQVFFILLALALIFSAIALIYQTVAINSNFDTKKYPPYISYLLEAGFCSLSGPVGIGCGSILSRMVIHINWAR